MAVEKDDRFAGGSRRAMVAAIAFLFGFAALLLVVVFRFLLPAMQVAQGADAPARRQLSAIAALVLVLVMFCVLAFLVACFRPGRFLFPRRQSPRSRTPYVDAWEESARRLKSPPPDDQDEDR